MDNNEFISWFDQAAAPNMAGRATSFRAVLREMQMREHKSIVETGCIRQEGNWAGDGQSALIWSKYIKTRYNGSFTTCDIDQAAVDLTNKLVGYNCADCCDSVAFLRGNHRVVFDVLYLDSYDVDMGNPHPAALHALMELTSAMPSLRKGSIVFVDDSPIEFDGRITGKGLYIAEFFKHLGVTPFVTGYQAAWIMP